MAHGPLVIFISWKRRNILIKLILSTGFCELNTVNAVLNLYQFIDLQNTFKIIYIWYFMNDSNQHIFNISKCTYQIGKFSNHMKISENVSVYFFNTEYVFCIC